MTSLNFAFSLAVSNPWLCALLFAAGLVAIIKGGDWFVDAASWIAEKTGIPKFIVGATIVSFATTLPELLVSLLASAEGHGFLVNGDVASALESVSMAIGNATGSVIANTGIILAIALLFIPATVNKKDFWFKPALLLVITLLLFGLTYFDGDLKTWEGIVLLLALVAFFWENIRSARLLRGTDEVAEQRVMMKAKHPTAMNLAKFFVGAFLIVLGARLLVDNGTVIATALGVPARVIAITLVAIGTSLPELVTTISAIAKKQASLSTGNILGANIIDTVLILPLSSLVYGGVLPVATTSMLVDCLAMTVLTVVAFLPPLLCGRFKRWQGVALLTLYAGYLTASFLLI